jgi:hypothetical protein
MYELGRYLTNIPNPHLPHAEMRMCYLIEDLRAGLRAMHHAWQEHLDWIEQNRIGPPKATEYYTQTQLEKMGYIGLYEPP